VSAATLAPLNYLIDASPPTLPPSTAGLITGHSRPLEASHYQWTALPQTEPSTSPSIRCHNASPPSSPCPAPPPYLPRVQATDQSSLDPLLHRRPPHHHRRPPHGDHARARAPAAPTGAASWATLRGMDRSCAGQNGRLPKERPMLFILFPFFVSFI
jgi:hypothetical protein